MSPPCPLQRIADLPHGRSRTGGIHRQSQQVSVFRVRPVTAFQLAFSVARATLQSF